MIENEQERPEDTVRRFAQRITELEDWKLKYREAAELWDALDMKENQQVAQGMLIAKVVDFTRNDGPMITASVTDGVDWVDEHGLIAAWRAISNSQKEYTTSEDEDDD